VTVKTADTEPLAHLWRRQFLAELDRKIASARKGASMAQPGGWYRGQIDEAIRMYEAARKAAAFSESGGSNA